MIVWAYWKDGDRSYYSHDHFRKINIVYNRVQEIADYIADGQIYPDFMLFIHNDELRRYDLGSNYQVNELILNSKKYAQKLRNLVNENKSDIELMRTFIEFVKEELKGEM